MKIALDDVFDALSPNEVIVLFEDYAGQKVFRKVDRSHVEIACKQKLLQVLKAKGYPEQEFTEITLHDGRTSYVNNVRLRFRLDAETANNLQIHATKYIYWTYKMDRKSEILKEAVQHCKSLVELAKELKPLVTDEEEPPEEFINEMSKLERELSDLLGYR